MSDSDLASALDIKHPLHRKKLRLAIEEKRNQVDGYVPLNNKIYLTITPDKVFFVCCWFFFCFCFFVFFKPKCVDIFILILLLSWPAQSLQNNESGYFYRACPTCSTLDHTWVAHKWLHDIGLPQYSPVFESNLVDGRMLNNLSRKDMEKHLEIHRKFHQTSIVHAVELLRRLGFDKEVSCV